MKRIIIICLSALLISACAITAFALANKSEADIPPAGDAVVRGDAAVKEADVAVDVAKAYGDEINVLKVIAQRMAAEPVSYKADEIFAYTWSTVPNRSYDDLVFENGGYVYVGESGYTQLPEDFLKTSSTEKLVELAVRKGLTHSRMLSSELVLDNLYARLARNVDLIAEIESRDDAAYYLLKSYIASPKTEDVAENFRLQNIEFLLTRKVYAEKLTDEQFKIFVLRLHQNVTDRDNSEIVSNVGNSIYTYDEYVTSRYNEVCAHFGIAPLNINPRQSVDVVIDESVQAAFTELANGLR